LVRRRDHDALRQRRFPNATQLAYVVDGANRRIGKRINGQLVQGFLYEDHLRPAAEVDGAGSVVSQFIYGTRINLPT